MEWLDHFVVEKNKILVFGLVESRVLDIAYQIVRDLMPHPVNE
jgi:hypothetical protein